MKAESGQTLQNNSQSQCSATDVRPPPCGTFDTLWALDGDGSAPRSNGLSKNALCGAVELNVLKLMVEPDVVAVGIRLAAKTQEFPFSITLSLEGRASKLPQTSRSRPATCLVVCHPKTRTPRP